MATIPYPGAHASLNDAINAAAPGDVVEVTGTITESVTITNSGTPGNPITIRAAAGGATLSGNGWTLPTGNTVGLVEPDQVGFHPCRTQPGCVNGTCEALDSSYSGLVQFNGANYIVWDGIRITESRGRGVSMNGGSNITVQNCEIDNSRRSAIVCEGNGNTFLGDNLDAHDNILYKAWDAEFPFWPIAVGSKQFDGFTITNSDIYRNWGEGLSFDRDTTNILFDGNRVWDNWALQIYVHNATNAVVRNNIVWYSDDVTFHRGCNPPNGIVINTEQFLIEDGADPTANVDVYNNLVFVPSNALNIWDNENFSVSDDIQIFNNTFVGWGGGVALSTLFAGLFLACA